MIIPRVLVLASLAAAAAIPAVVPSRARWLPQSQPPHLESRAVVGEANKVDPPQNDTQDQPAASPADKPKMHLEFHYSNNWVMVGNMVLPYPIRTRAYDNSDETGIQADFSYDQYGATLRCMPQTGVGEEQPDLKVRIKHSGQWGKIDEIAAWEIRNQLIDIMWQLVDKIADKYDTLYEGCTGCHGRAAMCNTNGAICGLSYLASCNCGKLREPNIYYDGWCTAKKTLWKLPSEMSLKVYDGDGSLRADQLTISVSSSVTPDAASNPAQCGRMGAVTEVAMSFVPFVGKYIEKGVKILCRDPPADLDNGFNNQNT